MIGGPEGSEGAMNQNGAIDPVAGWRALDSVLLRNLRVVDPAGESRGTSDLWVRHGMLEAIGQGLPVPGGPAIDFGGAVVMPGLFDMHVHFREPGDEDSETIASGALAAARGGFTGVACMPNTPVRIDGRSVIELIHARAHEACGTRVHPVGAMTRNLEGKELTEMAELKQAGAVAVSDDGHPVESSEVMRRGMEYARMCGLPVLSHSEERSLRGQGVMHEGY
jgi:dihydroorotase